MKKLQSIFAALAVVVGITGALAFTPRVDDPCASITQFYAFNPDTQEYVPVVYDPTKCARVINACYYYYDAGSNTYLPCPEEIYGKGPHIFN